MDVGIMIDGQEGLTWERWWRRSWTASGCWKGSACASSSTPAMAR